MSRMAMMMNRNTVLGSFQKWNIGSVIRDLLLADEALKGKVGDHIYPCIAPENTAGDFIVYRREKYSKSTVHQGVYEDECKLSLTIISNDYDSSTEIAGIADNILTGQHLINDGKVKLRMDLVDSTEGYDDDKYFQILLFEIK